MSNENTEKKPQKVTTTHKILIVGFSIIIIALCIIGYQILKPKQQTIGNGALVVDESNLAKIQEEIASKEAKGMFEVNMNTVWHFENGTSPSSDAYLANSGVNNFPVSFEIIVDEEVVYTSTVIPTGNMIKEIVLEKDLDAGTYAAVCQYTLWNEDGTKDSDFGVNITLVIKE